MIRVLLITRKRSELKLCSGQDLAKALSEHGAKVARIAVPGAHAGDSPKKYDIVVVFECNGDARKMADAIAADWAKYRIPVVLWTFAKQEETRDALAQLASKNAVEAPAAPKEETMKEETKPTPAPLTIVESKTIDGFKLVRIEGDEKPRILDTDLAERLEYERPRDIRQLIKRLEPELLKLGEIQSRCTVQRQPVGPNGQGSREYEVVENYLNEEQAALVATQSKTPKAMQITIAMVKVFVAWGRGELPGQKLSALEIMKLQVRAIEESEAKQLKLLEERIAPLSETAMQAKADATDAKVRSENASEDAAKAIRMAEDTRNALLGRPIPYVPTGQCDLQYRPEELLGTDGNQYWLARTAQKAEWIVSTLPASVRGESSLDIAACRLWAIHRTREYLKRLALNDRGVSFARVAKSKEPLLEEALGSALHAALEFMSCRKTPPSYVLHAKQQFARAGIKLDSRGNRVPE